MKKIISQQQAQEMTVVAKKASMSIEEISGALSKASNILQNSIKGINDSFEKIRINSLPQSKSIYHN